MVRGNVVGLILIAVCGSAGNVVLAASDTPLPVTNLTLYRSGVGYFERAGLVQDDTTVQLRFATDQINDILKSMIALDLDGGDIEGASYGSKEPLARRLASFAVNIADNPSMGTLINRLRGARLELRTTEGPVSGVVVGVEERPVVTREDTIAERPYVNLMTPSGVRSVDLTQVSSFEILDEMLKAELAKALEALAEHRADNTKAVDLVLRGQGSRRVLVAYVHEMPVWKTSYRLVMPDDSGGEPTLQGWAIVENTTDEDWTNIKLSLVAGQPVGFRMDLYQPLFLDRPELPVPVTAGVIARAYEGDVMSKEGLAIDDARSVRRSMAASPAPAMELDALRERAGPGGGGQSPLSYSARDMAEYAARAQASAAEVGEVFQYQLDRPVTISRRRSAMLPILASAVEGRRVSIFNVNDGLKSPMRGVEINNTSGLQLMPGPISVFDGAAFAGDSQIGHVSAGDQRLLAYAVDLDCISTTESKFDANVMSLRIVGGMIEETRRSVQTTNYAFKNNDAKRDRTIIVEHTKQGGWDLAGTTKPASETPSAYRFEVQAAASESVALEVQLERTDRQSFAVTQYNMQTLLAYSRDGKASEQVVAAVREAARLAGRVSEVERQIAALEKERNDIAADQTRVRENMGRIDRNTDLYARYLKNMGEQETRLEAIRTEIEAARTELEKRRNELNQYVGSLNVR
ncbi:MAG: hypothetical protein KF757_06800 [Phycisphaeraceae bacterium]|nr:hypothetical protein [Phycisphaeraceae bacterium]MCW5763313.1 hypothetical protein [Phycisphaeraceae bacterium]